MPLSFEFLGVLYGQFVSLDFEVVLESQFYCFSIRYRECDLQLGTYHFFYVCVCVCVCEGRGGM